MKHAPAVGLPLADALAAMIASLEAMSLHQPAAEPFDWGRDYLWQVSWCVWREETGAAFVLACVCGGGGGVACGRPPVASAHRWVRISRA